MTLELEHFEAHLAEVAALIADYQAHLMEEPVVPASAPDELYARLVHSLPREGTALEQVLDDVREQVIPFCTKVGHPRFLAWMNNSSSPAGMLGELLTVGLGQVPFTYKGGPAATVLENIVVQWFGELFGFPAGHGGTLVSGGTVANLTALTVAREVHGDAPMRTGLQGAHAPLTLYMSAQGHSSVERAVGILGLGYDRIRRIPIDDCFKMRIDALVAQLEADIQAGCRPFCVVAQAGAANTGAIDPLPELAAVCAEYSLWLHVDAAYGGAAILTETGRALLRGIDAADSITCDPHKWFYMPVEAGLVLIRDRAALYQTFAGSACRAYKGPMDEHNLMNYGIQYARMSRALKIWFALRVYGLNQIAQCVEQNRALAQELVARLHAAPDWEVLHPVELSIVCFRYVPEGAGLDGAALDALQTAIVAELEASGVALLTTAPVGGRVGIRVCFANHRTTAADVELLFETLTQIAARLTPVR